MHIPLQARPELLARYARKPSADSPQANPIYAAMLESLDEGVGRLVRKLGELKLDERTIIIFTSDNGGLSVKEGPNTPATSNLPLRAGKGYLYEGGIRVPLLVAWPGVTRPGSVSSVPVSGQDLFPTIREMAGMPTDSGPAVDGESLVPVLRGSGMLRRDALFWHYPHYSNQGGKPGGAIREGDFKLIEWYEDGRVELYDLRGTVARRKTSSANARRSRPIFAVGWPGGGNRSRPRCPRPTRSTRASSRQAGGRGSDEAVRAARDGRIEATRVLPKSRRTGLSRRDDVPPDRHHEVGPGAGGPGIRRPPGPSRVLLPRPDRLAPPGLVCRRAGRDGPGCGSSRPTGRAWASSDFVERKSPLEAVDDVEDLAKSLRLDSFSVIGISGGAPYALAVLLRMAERVRTATVISGMGPTQLPGGLHGMDTRRRLLLAAGSRYPQVARKAFHIAARRFHSRPERFLERLMKTWTPPDQELFRRREVFDLFLKDLHQVFAHANGPEGLAQELSLYRNYGFALDDLPKTHRVTIWHGLTDNIVPPAMAWKMVQAVPNAEAHFLPGGHFMAIETAGLIVARLMQQLAP